MEKYENKYNELKIKREEAGITLQRLCDEIGLTVGVYSLYENGKRLIKDEAEYEYLYNKVCRAIYKITKSEEYKFTHITNNILEQAVSLHNRGHNIVKIATTLNVDERILERALNKIGIYPLEFNKY